MKLYQIGRLGLWHGRQAGWGTRSSLIFLLGRYGLSPFGQSPDELDDDLANASLASYPQQHPSHCLLDFGRFDLLRDLYGEVMIPPAVHAEFLATEREARESALADAPWIKTVQMENPRRVLVYTGLDEGEATVLALAEDLGGVVMMDERKGRRYATRLGLLL